MPDVQIIRVDGNDVVDIGEFACVRAEAEVGRLREFEGLGLEALGPFVFGFVLELDFERGVLIVGHSHLLGNGVGTSDTAGLGFLCQCMVHLPISA